jgi:hypothetical protein
VRARVAAALDVVERVVDAVHADVHVLEVAFAVFVAVVDAGVDGHVDAGLEGAFVVIGLVVVFREAGIGEEGEGEEEYWFHGGGHGSVAVGCWWVFRRRIILRRILGLCMRGQASLSSHMKVDRIMYSTRLLVSICVLLVVSVVDYRLCIGNLGSIQTLRSLNNHILTFISYYSETARSEGPEPNNSIVRALIRVFTYQVNHSAQTQVQTHYYTSAAHL